MIPISLMLSGRAKKVSYRCDGRECSGPDELGKHQIRLLAEASLEIWSKKENARESQEHRSTASYKVHGHIYIVAPYGNAKSWYRSPHPKPTMLAAVLQGCTSILGSGSGAIGAVVAATVVG